MNTRKTIMLFVVTLLTSCNKGNQFSGTYTAYGIPVPISIRLKVSQTGLTGFMESDTTIGLINVNPENDGFFGEMSWISKFDKKNRPKKDFITLKFKGTDLYYGDQNDSINLRKFILVSKTEPKDSEFDDFLKMTTAKK